MSRGRIVPFVVLASLATAIPRSPAMSRPGSNTDPAPGPVGQPPYEMAGRAEARPPLAHFADCTVWTVEAEDAEADLYRTREQRLFREYCGKLVYHATGKRPVITVRPQAPVPIPEPWDCLDAWNWGNVWAWVRQKDTPPLRAEALVLDADGREHAIALGSMAYQYWFPMHRKVTTDIPRPARFAGFRFRNGTNTEPRRVYLGPVYFYQEELKPLDFDPWPEKLPFPTRPETILPTNKTAAFTNAARPEGGTMLFEYKGDDTAISYRLDPAQPFLDGLEALWDGRAIRPLRGAQVVLVDGATAALRVTQATPRDGGFHIEWECTADNARTVLAADVRIRQKSLILDLREDAPTGGIAKLTLGRAEGLVAPKTFWVPYLTYGGKSRDPRILLDGGLFLFSQFDWYVSDASELFGCNGRTGPDWAEFNGGATYNPKTDGLRNPLRERLFLTASPDVHEVFPNIPNPPSPMREAQADRLWRVRSGANHQAEIDDAKRLRALGLEKVTVRYHEDSWRDAGESYTFRTDAAPGRGGDAALKHMVASVQALGWRVGLYTNYTDYAPVNALWNEDWVTRTSDGNWLGAWTRCYAPKPMIAVQMQAKLAPQIQAKFGENHSYCDVHTCVTPFQRVDYDTRVPGAGTFRRTFECFGRLLHNEKFAHHGPVYSEGKNHWWYAGLTDGNYAQLNSPEPPAKPLFVDFDLLKMHPLQMDAGMGSPGMFYQNSKLRDYRQFIATTLAYGHIGFLEGSEADMMRMYYLLQPLQKHYVMRPVEAISYDGEPIGQALAGEAFASGRVRVDYEGGTSVWVNGGDTAWLAMPAPEFPRLLPKWGFVGYADGGRVRSLHALLPALPDRQQASPPRRMAGLSHGPDSHYLATGGGFLRTDSMATDGAGALKREPDGWELIPARQFGVFGFAPFLVDCADRPFAVRGIAADGALGAPAPVRWSRGLCYVLPGEGAPLKYRVVPGAGETIPAGAPDGPGTAVLGQDVQIALPSGTVAAARWHGADGPRPAMLATRETGVCSVTVPADLPADRLLWLELQSAQGTRWLDFLSASPLAVRIEIPPTECAPGTPVPVRLVLDNRLGQLQSFSLALRPTVGTVTLPEPTVAVPALGQTTVEVPWHLPWQAGTAKLEVSSEVAGTVVRATRDATTEVVPRVVLDLLQDGIAWRKGSCSRGEPEIPGLPAVYDGSVSPNNASCGKVTRKALFMHPPWGTRRTGYVFGEIPIDLPKEPVRLRAFTGLRDGMDASDGVVFSVRVTPEGRPSQTVFERHHKQLAWELAEVDLSAFAGQKVTLRLQVDCGPADNTTADHSQWGDLALVFAQDVLRVR